MHFNETPEKYYHSKKDLNSNRYEKGVYKEISNTSCYTSILSIGIWRLFGGQIARNESEKVFYKSIESGLNHIDCANGYGRPPGSAEEEFGRLLKRFSYMRDELIISSKAGYEMLPGPNGSGSSLKHLRSQIEGSLKRLKLDYVDIFYTHRYASDCSLEVVADSLKYLHDKGYFLYAGISSYPEKELNKIISLLIEREIPIGPLQYNISLMNLDYLRKCKSCYEKWGITTIAFSPLSQGIITSNYIKGEKDMKSRLFDESTTVIEPTNEGKNILNKLTNKLDSINFSLEEYAIGWLISKNFICSAVYGPRIESQILKMKRLKELINLIKDEKFIDEEREFMGLKTLKEIDKWKPRSTNQSFDIIN